MELENPFGCGNSPLFTYPFFGEDELINLVIAPGTRESVLETLEIVLCIDISFKSSVDGCHCYLGVSDEKILKESRLKIENKLNEMAGDNFSISFHHSWIEYQSIIKGQESNDCNYIDISKGLASGVGVGDGDVVKLNNPLGFYNRIQIILPFFIEAATPINLIVPKWSIYLSVSNNKTVINGLLTSYSYFKFPEGSRVRISQVLIFPRFQGHGLGTRLYESVTRNFRESENDCVEICVEDPTDGFERLRGLVDWKEAEILGIWNNEEEIKDQQDRNDKNDQQGQQYQHDRNDQSIFQNQFHSLIKSLKLNEEHAERLINLNKFLNSPSIPTNPKRLKPSKSGHGSVTGSIDQLRQDVKRWLLKKYRKDLPEGKGERIEKLSELYESELIEFFEPLIDLLKK